jgi:2-polyprenyl-6-methoxyphenol hydroxylase-like FAD-dependent oxidoreductase
VHHQEEIVIVGGGLGGLCFAAALHRYAITRPSDNYHDLTRIRSNRKLLLIEYNILMGVFGYFWSRLGLRAVVLEKSDRLRSEGTAIVLWTNAMHVLEVLGLADQFRSMYINLPGYALVSPTYA